MKFLKVLIGTAKESISGRQPLTFQNLENWENLWQVIDELQSNRNVRVLYWNCPTSVAFDKGNFQKTEWFKSRVYSADLLISIEYELNNPNERCIYIRRGYARRLQTPVEKELGIMPFGGNLRKYPYIHYFNDHNGNLLDSHGVLRWLELLEIWSKNGLFKPYHCP